MRPRRPDICRRTCACTPTRYAGPLAREGADCAPALVAFLDSPAAAPRRKTAQSLLQTMERASRRCHRLPSDREADKQIATALGLSAYGVRYHLRKLFAKLGVSTRAGAVRRAREMGLLPDD